MWCRQLLSETQATLHLCLLARFFVFGRADPFSAVIWIRANLRCVPSVLRGWCVTFAPGRSVPSGYSTCLHARCKYGMRNLPPHECTISHETAAIIGPLNNVLSLLEKKLFQKMLSLRQCSSEELGLAQHFSRIEILRFHLWKTLLLQGEYEQNVFVDNLKGGSPPVFPFFPLLNAHFPRASKFYQDALFPPISPVLAHIYTFQLQFVQFDPGKKVPNLWFPLVFFVSSLEKKRGMCALLLFVFTSQEERSSKKRISRFRGGNLKCLSYWEKKSTLLIKNK